MRKVESVDALMKPGGIPGAVVNLAVASLGAGVLSIPAGFAEAGLGFAAIITVVVGVYTVIAIGFLSEAICKLELSSYESLARRLLGPVSESIVRGIIIFYCFGTAVGYIVLVGEMAHPFEGNLGPWVASLPQEWRTTLVRVLMWAVVMVPAALVRNINALRYSSLFAVLAAVYLSGLIVFRYFFPIDGGIGMVGSLQSPNGVARHLSHHEPFPLECQKFPVRMFNWNIMLFLSLPIMMFSFDCQTIVFQLYHSLRYPSVGNMLRVGSFSTLIAACTYFAIGIFGYLSTGPCVKGNILLNYNPKVDPWAATAYLLYFIPVVMAYAMAVIPTRDAIFNVVYNITPGSDERVPDETFYGVSVAISFASLFFALFVPGILVVSSFLGGICSSTVCFTLPAIFAIEMDRSGIIKADLLKRLVMYSMLFLGVVGGILGTGVAVYQWHLGEQ